jgi:Nucleotidyl transferase AbiEii toxin, Type IV TA system
VSRISRGTPASDAYIDLQGQARRTGRPTQDLLQLYVLEGFLDRLAVSDLRDSFVLKGGVLLAAFDTRRPTKDVDLAGLNLANDTNTVLEFVRTVLIVAPSQDDGVEFFPDTATAMLIREGDAYSGVRVHVNAGLVTARLPSTWMSTSATQSGLSLRLSPCHDCEAARQSSSRVIHCRWCTRRRS